VSLSRSPLFLSTTELLHVLWIERLAPTKKYISPIQRRRPENRRNSEISLQISPDGPTTDLFLLSRLDAKRRRRSDFRQIQVEASFCATAAQSKRILINVWPPGQVNPRQ